MAEEAKKKDVHSGRANHTLAHSYAWYFVFLLGAIALDFVFPVRIFHSALSVPAGFALLFLATILIVWAECTHHHRLDPATVNKEALCRGPYCYTRHPTHWGVFLLLLGFGILLNAFFVILFTIVGFALSKLVFLKKHDSILSEKYGRHYEEYKKSVKL